MESERNRDMIPERVVYECAPEHVRRHAVSTVRSLEYLKAFPGEDIENRLISCHEGFIDRPNKRPQCLSPVIKISRERNIFSVQLHYLFW